MWALGLVLTLALGAGLAAINWQRLGERKKAVTAWVTAAVGVGIVLLAALAPVGSTFRALMLGANACGMGLVTSMYAPFWNLHREVGGARANRVIPLIIFLVSFCLLSMVALAFDRAHA